MKQEFQGEMPDNMTVREIARPSIVAILDEFIPTPGSPLTVVQEEIFVESWLVWMPPLPQAGRSVRGRNYPALASQTCESCVCCGSFR